MYAMRSSTSSFVSITSRPVGIGETSDGVTRLMSAFLIVTTLSGSARFSAIQLAENLAEPDKVVTIKKADISRVTPSDVSPMPTGLLVMLTKDEVLDLIAYIVAMGNAKHPAFSD